MSMLPFFGFGIGFGLITLLVLALVLVFEIWMLVDVITNHEISDNAKILWVIGMILIHPIIAIIYYFTDHQKHPNLHR